MPVLDIHVHMGRRHHLTPWVLAFLAGHIGQGALQTLEGITPADFEAFIKIEGVDRAVLLAEYSPKTTGVVPNEFTAGFCQGSDVLIPFGSVNLEDEVDAGTQVERCVRDLGCRGIKLLPSYGHFYPDDPRIMPAYEAAARLRVPIIFHTGTSLFPGSRIRFADPLLLDDIAENFPDLKIIMAHGGRPFWYKQAEWLLRRHTNTYIDISGIPPLSIPEAFPKFEQFPDRFVFGSDWPLVPSIALQIEHVRRLPYRPETIQAVLWDNGARLLALEPLPYSSP